MVKAPDEFHTNTTAPNQLWLTDFTYLKVIGWGWFFPSTVLDDFSRYVVGWKLCTTTAANDVTDTLELALEGSGGNTAQVRHRPRLLSDNGPCYATGELAGSGMPHTRGVPAIRRQRARSSAGTSPCRIASSPSVCVCGWLRPPRPH